MVLVFSVSFGRFHTLDVGISVFSGGWGSGDVSFRFIVINVYSILVVLMSMEFLILC
jgi:hypothetical protein